MNQFACPFMSSDEKIRYCLKDNCALWAYDYAADDETIDGCAFVRIAKVMEECSTSLICLNETLEQKKGTINRSSEDFREGI